MRLNGGLGRSFVTRKFLCLILKLELSITKSGIKEILFDFIFVD
jgi:hypothetical protein